MSDGMKRILAWFLRKARPTHGLALGRNPIGMREQVQLPEQLSDQTARRLLALSIYGIGK